jgi:hypothetical protein
MHALTSERGDEKLKRMHSNYLLLNNIKFKEKR